MKNKFVNQSLLGVTALLVGTVGINQLAHADTVNEFPVNDSKKDATVTPPYQEMNIGSMSTAQNDSGGAFENAASEPLVKSTDNQVPEGYQGAATNVNYTLTNSYASQPGTELQDISLGFLGNYHFGIQGSFTLNTSELKLNNKIYLGSIMQSNSTGDNSHNVLLSNHDNMSYLSYMGDYVGSISFENIDDSRSDLFLTVKQENNFTTPTISITKWIDNDVWGYNWESDPKLYKNVPDKFVQNIMLPNGKVYHVNLYNNISRLWSLSPRSIGVQGTHAFNIYDWMGLSIYKNGGRVTDVVDGDLLKRIDAGDKTAILPNTGYQAVYSYKAVANVGAPGEVEILPNVFVKDKEN